MEKRGIGVGSSPIGDEGFAHPSARLRRSKTKIGFYTYILYIYIIAIILSVTHMWVILHC